MRPCCLVILFLMAGRPLWAFGLDDIRKAMRETRDRVVDAFTPETPLPPNSRIEEVRSAFDDPMITEDCSRIIRGGNFWGESAVDLCCTGETRVLGEGPEAITCNVCYLRLPSRVEAFEPWVDFLDCPPGPAEIADNRPLPSPSPWNLLFPDLLAQAGGGAIPFAPEERAALAAVLDVARSSMLQALAVGDPMVVGAPESEFRVYWHLSVQGVGWALRALQPGLYPCPSGLEGYCAIAPSINFIWDPDLPSRFGALAVRLDFIRVHSLYRLVTDIENVTPMSHTIAHEAGHQMNHFTGRLGGYRSPDLLLLYDTGWESLLSEATSLILESIVAQFIPGYLDVLSPYRGVLAYRKPKLDQRFSLLRTNSFTARYADIPYYYWAIAIWNSLSPVERLQSVADARGWPEALAWAATDRQMPPYMEVVLTGSDRVVFAYARQFEDQYQAAGGTCGLWTASGGEDIVGRLDRTGALLCMSSQPELDHDTTESPDAASPCESPVPSSEEEIPVEEELPANCEPPDCEGDPEDCEENPEDLDAGEPDPGAAIPECVRYYTDTIADGGSVGTYCYTWCWDPENNDLAPGLCQHLREDDRESACELGSQRPGCRAELDDWCVAHPGEPECLVACRADRNRAYCDEVCGHGENFREPFCHERCLVAENWPTYCGQRCHEDAHQDYCIRRCGERNGGAAYCDDLCASNPTGYDFCDEVCDTDPILYQSWCADLCYQSGFWNRSFCQSFCMRTEYGFCRDVCHTDREFCRTMCAAIGRPYCDAELEEPPSPPPPSGGGEGGSGCPSGWTYRRGSIRVAEDGCFPFVGNVKCCGGSCEPNGSNEACLDQGFCGCDPDPDLFWEGYCIRPESGDWDRAMQPSSSEELFYLGNQGCARGAGYTGDECVCFGIAAPVHCYPNNSSVPAVVRGLCCDDYGTCVTRTSLGLQP